MTQLVSTRSTAIQPASEQASTLDVELRYAKAIASAGDVLPRAYRANPGAVLLAKAWADSRGLDVLTAIQTVAFIDGKPVVDATMQRALAERQGFDVRVVDVTIDSATVEVWRDGARRGSATYTLGDAQTAGLAEKKNWKQNPKAMLVARATTQALRWFAPTVVVGIHDADEIDAPIDPVQVLTPQPPPQADVTPAEAAVEDAVVVDAPQAQEVDPRPLSTLEQLKATLKEAGMRQADILRDARAFAQAIGSEAPVNLQAIADDPQLFDWAIGWVAASNAPEPF